MKRLNLLMVGLVVGLVLVGSITFSQTASQFSPLPLELRIIPPPVDLPKNIAGFSGIWYGVWDNGNPTILVVEKIEPPTAIVVYSWGGQKGGWRRSEWKIEPNKLENDSEGGITITYFLSNDSNTLEGTYTHRGKQTRINYTTMQRDVPESLSPPAVSAPMPLPWGIKIIPPSPDLSKEIAGFSGIWHGVWDNGRKTTLVVEKIESPTAIAIYSWGEYKGKEGGWTRWEWSVKPGKLELRSEGSNEVTITYIMLPTGELKGTWKKGWTKLQGIMRKE